MKRILLFSIPAVVIIILNVMYGSIISWMLSITIIACLIFFVAKLGLESLITKKMADFKPGDTRIPAMLSFDKKWKSILSFSLMTLVFLTSIWGVYFTMDPKGKYPWFTNNEYHGLSNAGIAFSGNLKVLPIQHDSSTAQANIVFYQTTTDQVNVQFNHFFQPVLALDADGNERLINSIFPTDVQKGFTLKSRQNELAVTILEKQANLFQRILGAPTSRLTYSIKINVTDQSLLDEYNLRAPFSDVITLEDAPLQKGKSIFNLFLDNKTFQSSQAESYQVLEHLLMEFGETYLLAEEKNEAKTLRLFPGYELIQNGYQLFQNGQRISAQIKNSNTLAPKEDFYIGFNNQKKRMFLDTFNSAEYGLNTTKSIVLRFDYPNTYMLKSPGAQARGDKNIRFITNNFEQIIQNNLQEGFHFTTYNLKPLESINGTIDYITGAPNSPLAIGITDAYRNGTHKEIKNQKFALNSSNPSVQYLFEVRDFSQNGFALPNTVLYLGLTYLAFVILCTFFGGKKIDRIEPIVLSIVLALLSLRYIMFWRVATFPPLENISKYELEKTLINFDFNLGAQLPVPLTLIWTVLFVVILAFCRWQKDKLNSINPIKILRINPAKLSSIHKSYAIFMGVCLVLFFANKSVLHIEPLTRLISILIPLIGYWYYSKLANQHFTYQPFSIIGEGSKWLLQIKAYVYYLCYNPTFIITVITLLFFALADRGFAILFALFILLKNIFISFLKKPLDLNNTNVARMLYKPHNYWIYGFTALIIYLVTLSFKSLFYYLLAYKLWVIGVFFLLSLAIIWVLYPQKKKLKKIGLGAIALWLVLMAIPPSRNLVDHQINEVIKHVQYRASIIHQPIGDLMQQNEYTSFKTRKIIETAENQWFINSYISKDFDNNQTLNLRPHSRVGVDYSTQTRDVVVARYIISEMGNLVMYLILGLLLLPLVLYLISYRVQLLPLKKGESRDIGSYAGLIPLILLFTISLFVWLTATNRFVFFGQDFPFLSLTSRVAVIMPLILLGLTLSQTPTAQQSFKINLKNNTIKYALFFGLIAVFALSTVKQNELNNKNFSVIMDTTKKHIDGDLNNILEIVQDSLAQKRIKPSYAQLIKALENDKRFETLKNEQVKDAYTKSILENLIAKPSSALQLDNPLFIIYDNGRYNAVYNKNLYLELPPVESRKIWNGTIYESIQKNDFASAVLTLKGQAQQVNLPYFVHDPSSNIQLALIPGNWLGDSVQQNKGLINVNNSGKTASHLYVYKNKLKNIEQNAVSFVSTLEHDDMATVYQGNKSFTLGFRNAGNRFSLNKWVNGAYKIIYPLKEDNFWIYNFSNAIKTAYSNPERLNDDVKISLDYQLSKTVQEAINVSEQQFKHRSKNYNFSVIAADGNGNIRLMADYVSNRKALDPNNEAAIFQLQKQQFFYSNAKNERDQWGNRNLLNLFLGPGSSIKPLTAAVVASQVNAGWENLMLTPPLQAEMENFAGYNLIKPWKNDEHYFQTVDLAKYIEVSSNFYQSLVLFLGSYGKEAFMGKDNAYNLKNLLIKNPEAKNKFPQMQYNGQSFYLPNYNKHKGNWPKTDLSEQHKSYFGNENSILANGLELNANLRTKDKDKNDLSATSQDRVNFVDTTLAKTLQKHSSGGYLWSFPEQSFFLQSERAYDEIHQNVTLGLKTSTLGGYPYRITPYMMLQMYMSMASQNRNFRLNLSQRMDSVVSWHSDDTWKNKGVFNSFMAQHIFKGMKNVIYGGNGTAKRLQALGTKYPNLHFYAKTGTINEQNANGKSSRRLILIATDKDITEANNIGRCKQFAWFFATDNTGDFDWNLLTQTIDASISSAAFKNYFNY